MRLGFSVETLLPSARVSGPLRMGLVRLAESEWLDPEPDLAARNAHFDRYPDAVIVQPEAEAAEDELSEMLGVSGGLKAAARSVWEDLCLLTREGEELRLTAGALAFPTDWSLADKIGQPLVKVHAPIHGYAEQLSAGVDSFMNGLQAGALFGRTNAFVVASGAPRYLPEEPPETRFAHVTPDNAGETLFVRCERQTLRRLPRTGAILFTIGVYGAALGTLSDAAVARIAGSLDGYGDGEGARRAAPHYAMALSGYAKARSSRGGAKAA